MFVLRLQKFYDWMRGGGLIHKEKSELAGAELGKAQLQIDLELSFSRLKICSIKFRNKK